MVLLFHPDFLTSWVLSGIENQDDQRWDAGDTNTSDDSKNNTSDDSKNNTSDDPSQSLDLGKIS